MKQNVKIDDLNDFLTENPSDCKRLMIEVLPKEEKPACFEMSLEDETSVIANEICKRLTNVMDNTCRNCGNVAIQGSFFCNECKDEIISKQFESNCASTEMAGMSRLAKGVYLGLSKDSTSVVYDPLNDMQNSIFFGSPKGGTSFHVKS